MIDVEMLDPDALVGAFRGTAFETLGEALGDAFSFASWGEKEGLRYDVTADVEAEVEQIDPKEIDGVKWAQYRFTGKRTITIVYKERR